MVTIPFYRALGAVYLVVGYDVVEEVGLRTSCAYNEVESRSTSCEYVLVKNCCLILPIPSNSTNTVLSSDPPTPSPVPHIPEKWKS